MKKTGRILIWGLNFVGTAVLIYALVQIVGVIRTYHEGNAAYTEIAQKVQEEDPAVIDFEALKEINPQVVGWVKLDGTIIDYPVMKGEDNSYYLDHLYNREENWMGSVFLDYRTGRKFQNRLTPIYAHHTNNGAMFYLLEQYKQQTFYDAHPVLHYFTEDTEYELRPFAGMVVDSSSLFLRISFQNDEDFDTYLAPFIAGSTFVPEPYEGRIEKAAMLCTCTDDFENARYVLLCRIVEKENCGS